MKIMSNVDYYFSVWAVGCLAFEIFGLKNPFIESLDSSSYQEDEISGLSRLLLLTIYLINLLTTFYYILHYIIA